MATIGTFTRTIQTMGLKAKVAITPVEKRGESQPDYRVFVGKVEIGAGWARTGKDSGREFVSVKLDGPRFAAPIYATLVRTGRPARADLGAVIAGCCRPVPRAAASCCLEP